MAVSSVDVEPLDREQAQQPQPRLVAEQPEEVRPQFHIYKSTSIDVPLTSGLTISTALVQNPGLGKE